ncbi:MAG: hypothetical protein AAFY88_06160 [Acidobacteriota bacterium]
MDIDHQFLLSLRQLAVRARSADPTLHNLAYFRTPTDAELALLRKSVTAVLKEATECSQELLDQLLPTLEDTPLDDLGSLIRKDVHADLKAVESESIDESSTWQLGIAAVQLLSKVLKGAAAVENAYCHELELEAEITHVADMTTALEIRRTYQKFWLKVDAETPIDAQSLVPRLRSAATSIARLTGRSIFLDMRVLDRQLLLRLQRRILDWLKDSGDTELGMVIWKDLESFTSILRMINHRRELVEHDLALVPELMADLGERGPEVYPFIEDAALLSRAEALTGRDPDLDQLLENPADAQNSDLLMLLGQVEANALSQVQLPQAV